MYFYGLLVLIALGIVIFLVRSPVIRQLRRGRGSDSSGFGNRLWNVPRASNDRINEGGRSGKRESFHKPMRKPQELGLGHKPQVTAHGCCEWRLCR
jgi:hypothetical protein